VNLHIIKIQYHFETATSIPTKHCTMIRPNTQEMTLFEQPDVVNCITGCPFRHHLTTVSLHQIQLNTSK